MYKHTLEEQGFIGRPVALIAGIILTMIAFLVPMDVFGMTHMFTVHMSQHLLLSLAAPPLILLSIAPESLSRFLAHRPALARGLKYITLPIVAAVLFNGNIWIWHAPVLMQAMMSSVLLHNITNLLYLLTGLLFWWPLLDIPPQGVSLDSIGKKLAYLFFSDMPMMLIGAGLTFAKPLYSFTMSAPMMHMTVTADDQQLGGLLMWVVGGVFLYAVVASILFLRWMLQQERKQREEEEELFDEQEFVNEAVD